MDVKEIRKANLRYLIGKGTIRDFAEKADTDPAYISQILSAKIARDVGHDLARKIEERFQLGHGWMDQPHLAEDSGAYEVTSEDDLEPVALREVPIVGQTNGGTGGFWDELGYPAGHGDSYLDVPSKDKNAYALRVRGSSMAPRIYEGEVVLVEPNHQCIPGDEVVVRLRNTETMVKIFISDRGGDITLASIGTDERIVVPRDELRFMHFVCGVFRPGAVKTRP